MSGEKKSGSLIPAETWKAAKEYKITAIVGKKLQAGYDAQLICAAIYATGAESVRNRTAYFQSFFTEDGQARVRVPGDWALEAAKEARLAESKATPAPKAIKGFGVIPSGD